MKLKLYANIANKKMFLATFGKINFFFLENNDDKDTAYWREESDEDFIKSEFKPYKWTNIFNDRIIKMFFKNVESFRNKL